jgi:CRISPR system Cascade subunit CasC
MTNTFIDIHVLQTVPPSNLNRDDTGSPKTAVYGGVRRARVSSQAWKRAARKSFADLLDQSDLGLRTKRVVELVAERITKHNPEIPFDQAATLAADIFKAAGIKVTEPKGDRKGEPAESGYLLFLSAQQIDALARLAADGEQSDKKQVQALLKDKNSIDLALFGRMVADVTDLNVDASCQVAHALSTHAVDSEYDYFTAVDDHKAADAEEDAGAGMIGTVEFNSATLYRYATINIDQLQANLGSSQATSRAVGAFLQAFVKSMPTGKQNTFANRTLPDGVVFTIRTDQPVSWVGAFEEPVQPAQMDGRVRDSARKLVKYAKELDSAYGDPAVLTKVVGVGQVGDTLSQLGERESLDAAVAQIVDRISDFAS